MVPTPKTSAAPERSLKTLEWVGGHVALDFANTLGALHSKAPQSYLHSYGDLLEWCRQADLIGPVSIRYLSANSAADQAAAFAEAQRLVQSLLSLFQAAAHDAPLPRKALEHLNTLVQQTVAWRRVSTVDGEGSKINCGWDFKGAPAAAVLGPIVWRAMELLEHGPLDRIKECPAQGCGWVFLDTSKNRSRQWCSMKTCGNVSKVRRFRDRLKSP